MRNNINGGAFGFNNMQINRGNGENHESIFVSMREGANGPLVVRRAVGGLRSRTTEEVSIKFDPERRKRPTVSISIERTETETD